MQAIIALPPPQEIPKFKRTSQFTVEDYVTLTEIFRYFEKRVTTPNILTEVNSLSNQLRGNLKPGYFEKFAAGISLLDECYTASADIAGMSQFPRFGLTDTGILQLAKGNYLVLSDDFRLCQYLTSQDVDAINFNHIRVLGWR